MTLIYRRSWLVLWHAEHICAYCDVLILLFGCSRTEDTAVSLVEEVPDCATDGPIHPSGTPRFPTSLYRLQLSEGVCLVDRAAWRDVLLPVPQLLQPVIREEEIAQRVNEEGNGEPEREETAERRER